jgi:hypothetical protein
MGGTGREGLRKRREITREGREGGKGGREG